MDSKNWLRIIFDGKPKRIFCFTHIYITKMTCKYFKWDDKKKWFLIMIRKGIPLILSSSETTRYLLENHIYILIN